jgi:hypothetical protein
MVYALVIIISYVKTFPIYSCVTTFMVSALVNHGRFEMVAVQNASLAGNTFSKKKNPLYSDFK